MGNTKSLGIAYTDQDLQDGTMSGYTITGGTISGGAASVTNLTATGNVALGNASTDTLAFYGASATTQPAATNQAAFLSTAPVSVSATQWGFSTSTQALGMVNLLLEVRTALVALGLIKGSN